MNKFYLFLFVLVSLFCGDAYGQVVINEITPDPGSFDGQGGEWTELYNTDMAAPAPVGCWVLTDGEEIIVLPAGTEIPAGGKLLIYNSNFFACTACNWYTDLLTNLPAGTIALDLATCNCTNQTPSSCYAVTWDNNGACDRVALFDDQANIADAVYWGLGDKEALPADAILESIYATGQNTLGRNIIGTNVGCTLPATNNYDVPALVDAGGLPLLDAGGNSIWENIGEDIKGCTTSYIRETDGNAGWTTDNWPSPGQDNTIPDYAVTYSLNGGAAVPIDADALTINVCSGDVLTFNAAVYGYNQIYNTDAGDTGMLEGGSSRGGSNIDATGGHPLSNAAWNNESLDPLTGITTIDYMTTNLTANTVFDLFIKENTSGIGMNNTSTQCGGGLIIGSGSASECYIQKKITVNVTQPLASASLTCVNGAVTVTTVPATNTGTVTYNLVNAADPLLNQSNNSGQFLVTSGNAADYSITATQIPDCAPPVVVSGAICVFAPPCPVITTATGVAAGGDAAICPGEDITLDVTAYTDLPANGTIDWYMDAAAGFDPYTSTTATLIGQQPIPAIPSCGAQAAVAVASTDFDSGASAGGFGHQINTDGTWALFSTNYDGIGTANGPTPAAGQVYISAFQEAYSGALGTCTNGTAWNATSSSIEVIELRGDPGTNVGCWRLSDGNTEGVIVLPYGTLIPSDGVLVIGGGCDAIPNVDIDVNTCNCSQNNSFTLADGGDQIMLANSSGVIVDAIAYEGASTASQSVRASNASTSVIGGDPAPIVFAGFTEAECNTTQHIRGIVRPIDEVGCATADATTVDFAFTIDCPEVSIAGEGAICAGASFTIPVTVTTPPNPATGTMDINYAIDGVAQAPLTAQPLSGATITATAAGLYTITSVTFSDGACNAKTAGSASIIVSPLPAAPTASAQSVCDGQSTILTASGTGNLLWYSDAALTTQIGSGATINITAAASTTVYVKTVSDAGCESTDTPVNITVNPLPAATAAVVEACPTATFTATVTTGTPTIFNWVSNGAGSPTTAATNPVTIAPLANEDDGATFTLYVEDANGCYSTTTTPTVSAACSLPVELLSFAGTLQKGQTLLNWQTATETNNHYFGVERSLDGRNFMEVGKVLGNGTTTTPHFYNFIDTKPAFGANYYRLRQVDFDNTITYSQTIIINYRSNQQAVSLMPNPTQNNLSIALNEKLEKDGTLEIIDALGKIIRTEKWISSDLTKIIDVANLPAGTYSIRIQANEQAFIQRFVKID